MRAVLSLAMTLMLAGPVCAADLIVGVSEPLSGGLATFGQDARRGTELAFGEANAAGGVLGRKLVADVQDNRCNPTEAVRSVTQMLSDKSHVAVLDGLCSSAVLAIMPLAERAQVPLLVANASAISIGERSGVGGNKYVFKLNPSDLGLATALVNYLAKAGKADGIVLLGEDTDYGRSGAAGLTTALAPLGKKLAGQEYFQQGTAEFTSVLTKLRAENPASVAVYSLGADFQNLIRQMASNDFHVPLTGRILFDEIPREILASGLLDGTTAVQPYAVDVATPENKAFVEAYRKQFGGAPTQISFESYEAAKVLIAAIKASGTGEPAAIRDALAATSMPSILGTTITFDDHNLAHNNAVVMTIKDGKVVLLDFSKT